MELKRAQVGCREPVPVLGAWDHPEQQLELRQPQAGQ